MHSYWGAVAIRKKKGFYREKQSSFLQLCLCSESNTIMTILVKPCLHCQGKFSLLIKQASSLQDQWEHLKAVLSFEQSLLLCRVAFTSSIQCQLVIFIPSSVIRRYLVDVTTSFVRQRHRHRCCFLCSGDDPSPLLTLMCDQCTTIALTQAVVQREAQS